MRLMLDTSHVSFTVSQEAAPKVDRNTSQQRTEKDRQGRDTGRLLWTVQVVAMHEDGAEVIRVTVAGDKPEVGQGIPVQFKGLEAIPWTVQQRSGVAYRAEAVAPAAQRKAA